MVRGRRLNTLLFKFLTSYVLILAISLTLSMVIYEKTIIILEDNIKKSNLSMLEQSRDIIDKNIEELNSIIERVALNPKIISLSNKDKFSQGSRDIDILISAQDSFSTYRLTDSFIKELYIFFKSSDIIMTSSGANTNMKLMYGNYFKFGDMTYENWVSEIAGQIQIDKYIPSTTVRLNGKNYTVITRFQTIPLEYPKSNKGCIMAFIDNNAVNQVLQKISTGSSGYTYIMDENNTIITSVCPEGQSPRILDLNCDGKGGVMNIKVSGEEMVVSYTVSTLNGWKYFTAVPYGVVMEKVNYIRTIIFTAVLIILIGGILLSFLFSYKNAKPIRDIYDSLKELLGDTNGCKNEYSFLSESICNLASSNKDLGKKLDEQVPLVRAAFLKRLLHGSFIDMAEISANLTLLNINLPGPGFVAVILKISGYRDLINKNVLKELDLIRLIINQTIEETYSDMVVSCDLDETRIALLFSINSHDVEDITHEIENITGNLFEVLQSQFQINVSFTAGSVGTSLLDIGYSFVEAKQVMRYGTGEQDKKLVWYYQLQKQVDHYKYSPDMKKRLVDLVRAGDNKELKKFLKIIYLENFCRRKLSASVLRLFLYQLAGTLSELSEAMNLEYSEIVWKDFSQTDDLEYEFKEMSKCFRELSEKVCIEKGKSDDALCEKMISYLEEVYGNEDLTLYNIALHFNLTETFLYHFFKEKTGMTFASYLEKMRIDNAYRLLIETGLTVNEIAQKVGYGNDHSFRRAFKRCKGQIPSTLRNTVDQN